MNFIFQPAEEGWAAAAAMLEAGLLERFPCDTVFGMHNRPGLPVDKFQIRPGAMMAGSAFFDIRVNGRGAHGARPEESTDPVMAAATITGALQSIVSRNVKPSDAAVLSVTCLQAGHAHNVIPETAQIRGTARAFKREVMELMEANMKRLAISVAAGFGATAEVNFRSSSAPLVNDEDEANAYADAAAALVGERNVSRNGPAMMGSEDFSAMLEARPGAYINIGNGGDSRRCTTTVTISMTRRYRWAPACTPRLWNGSCRKATDARSGDSISEWGQERPAAAPTCPRPRCPAGGCCHCQGRGTQLVGRTRSGDQRKVREAENIATPHN